MKKSLKELRGYPVPSKHLPLKRWHYWKRFLYKFAEKTVPSTFEKLFKIHFSGLEHLKQFSEGIPVIFCGNHRSHLDSLILACGVVKERNYLAFMASGNALFSNPIFRLLKHLGAFPVYKENPEPALKYAEMSLRAGHAVAIFPEGKRYAKKSPHKGKTGVARIIERMNFEIPVIPFYIHGSAEALAIGGRVPLFGRYVSIHFDKAMYFRAYKTIKDSYQRLRTITDDIVNKINNLLKISESEFLERIEKNFFSLNNYVSIYNKID